MALSIDRETLGEFCPQLFRVLDGLGMLPRQLGWKRDASGKLQRIAPTEFEKYPRLLFGSIQRYDNVEAGFREWESRLLRDIESPSVKEMRYPDLETLHQWMVQHSDVFAQRRNMQHLRASLYARVFNYLYPRRVLVNTYCVKHQGNPNAIDLELLETSFPGSVDAEVQKLKETFSGEWATIVADAKATLIGNGAYYRKVLGGEEPVLPPEEDDKKTEEENSEEVSA